MTRRFARGLVVGKFAPLHRGHELVIRTAASRCDDLLVLSWANPERPGCGPERRAQWLRELFPAVRSVVLSHDDGPLPHDDEADERHRTFVGTLLLERLHFDVDAVFTSEDYGEGFAARLASMLGHPVAHVSVDRYRQAVPTSGTAIRADVHAHRERLDPRVYASFVRRVCLLGGESSGKTTLARDLARAQETAWVPEYGRELWEARSGKLVRDDMLRIAVRQVELEDQALLGARRHLFCDTSPLTTLLYALEMFGQADPQLVQLAQRRYDVTVLCLGDFDFVQDGTRRDAAFRDRQEAWYRAELAARGVPYLVVGGSLAERVAAVSHALGG